MRRALVSFAIICVAAACTEIIPATRENAYEFRLEDSNGALSFLWPRDSMPLKIWVDPAGPLYEPTRIAITRWESAVLYGEFRGTIVTDSLTANIIIHNDFPPPEGGGGGDDGGDDGGDGGGNLITGFHAFANQCTGFTTADLDIAAHTVSLPILVYVYANGTQTEESLKTCFRITTTHELGHALGILSHSASSEDVMFNNPSFDGISTADRETMELVFHSIPNLSFIPRAPFLRLMSSPFRF